MSTEQTPNPPSSLGPSEKLVDSAVHDTAKYMIKSLGTFLLSLSSLILTGLGWLFKGLSMFFTKLSEWSFLGAGKLHFVVARVKWHDRGEDKE